MQHLILELDLHWRVRDHGRLRLWQGHSWGLAARAGGPLQPAQLAWGQEVPHSGGGRHLWGRRRRKHLHQLHPLEQQHLDGHQQHSDRQEGRSLLLEDGGRLSHTDGGRLRQPLLRGCQHWRDLWAVFYTQIPCRVNSTKTKSLHYDSFSVAPVQLPMAIP